MFVLLALLAALDGYVGLQFPSISSQAAYERGSGEGPWFAVLNVALSDDDEDRLDLGFGPQDASPTILPAEAPRLDLGPDVLHRVGSADACRCVGHGIVSAGPRGPPEDLRLTSRTS